MAASGGGWGEPWVLIIEDDGLLAGSVARWFRHLGVAHVEIATGARAAREAARRPGLRGALVDILLPDANGIDLAAELRAAQPRAEILIWSGTDDIGMVQRANHHRFHFIAKGGDRALLAEAARRWATGAPATEAIERQLATIRSLARLTDKQARVLELALTLQTRAEMAAALGVQPEAIDNISARIAARTGRTLAQWSRMMREQLRPARPGAAGRRRAG